MCLHIELHGAGTEFSELKVIDTVSQAGCRLQWTASVCLGPKLGKRLDKCCMPCSGATAVTA